MEFLNIYLLGGLVLVGVPVLMHLLMRQKPRRLPFPAFRFLRQRSVVNRRLRLGLGCGGAGSGERAGGAGPHG